MITPTVVKMFRNYISAAAGIQLRRQDKIEQALSERIDHLSFENPYNYFRYLKYHPDGSTELRHLLSLLTINESSFFRGEHQFRALRQKILPDICNLKLKQSPVPSLSVWSAACSTGEEPYSIAIEIMEKLQYPQQWDIEILGTDVDKAILNEALKAEYNQWRLRNVSENRKQRYFKKEGNRFKLTPEVKKICSFDYHNLMEEPYPQSFSGKWDIIFCRNVFIYFDRDSIKWILKKFAELITEGGYLFLGNSESLYGISDEFKPVQFEEAFVYKKTAKTSAGEPVLKKDKMSSLPPAKEKPSPDFYRQAFEHYIKEDFSRAALEIEKSLKKEESFKACILAAKIYTEQNNLSRALKYAHLAIKKERLNSSGHFLAGLINKKMNNLGAAEKYFKSALYLKNDLGLANFHLAHIYEESGHFEKALRQYRNSLVTFKNYPPEEPLEMGGGFNPKTLIDLAEKQIKSLEEKVAAGG